MAKITINDLLEAGCHFGHQTRRWNPRMKDYVYTVKGGISIIDLTKTMRQIADACNFLQRTVAEGGEVLFVGTKPQLRETIKELAERTGMYSVSERWLGGTLTNNVTIRKSIAKMNEIDATLNSDAVNGMKKKEVASLSHRAEKLHRDLDGIAEMKKLPKVMVVVDVNNEMNAVREAIRLHIPIVAIVDTNGDPTLVDYPVAANDEAVKSVGIITNIFADAIKVAKEIYNKRAAEEREAAEVAKRVAEEQAANEEPAKEAKPRRTRKAAPADGEAKPRRTRKTAPANGETAPKAPAAPKAADAE
ncbi:MAG: 30S ribosomal protein S2 [Lentisphaerae bacterium]|nr:30S ribosomal protein S2 [Lentisphaerota bacterium]MBR2874019.1 30S ribosomal protein S2 [Lentisphaeria bacterium]